MPNQTFFNLPEAKREITKIAIAEFASHDYDSASITKIVKQAKIAKGSFYQYFEDKKELYLYLVDLANKEKIAFLQQATPPQTKMEFLTYLRWLFSVGTKFDLTHPALSQIIYRTVYGNVPFRDEVLKMTRVSSLEYIKKLVEQGIEQGDIATDIDPEMAAFAINTLGEGLRHFIPAQLGLNAQQLAEQGVNQDIDLQAVEQIFDDLFRILERGLGSKSAKAKSDISNTSKKFAYEFPRGRRLGLSQAFMNPVAACTLCTSPCMISFAKQGLANASVLRVAQEMGVSALRRSNRKHPFAIY